MCMKFSNALGVMNDNWVNALDSAIEYIGAVLIVLLLTRGPGPQVSSSGQLNDHSMYHLLYCEPLTIKHVTNSILNGFDPA